MLPMRRLLIRLTLQRRILATGPLLIRIRFLWWTLITRHPLIHLKLLKRHHYNIMFWHKRYFVHSVYILLLLPYEDGYCDQIDRCTQTCTARRLSSHSTDWQLPWHVRCAPVGFYWFICCWVFITFRAWYWMHKWLY